MASTAERRLRALGDRVADELFDFRQSLRRDQWALFHAGLERETDFQGAGRLGEIFGEDIVNS